MPPSNPDLEAFWPFCLQHGRESRSQFLQDVFVRWVLGDNRDGYFVEFGAADGVYLSNSHFLETEREWVGILVDYLSIDTEGSELAILQALDFSRYAFRIITVEHNYTVEREELWRLLSRHGYERTLVEFSRVDDWYVHASVARPDR